MTNITLENLDQSEACFESHMTRMEASNWSKFSNVRFGKFEQLIKLLHIVLHHISDIYIQISTYQWSFLRQPYVIPGSYMSYICHHW